jgi:hypothetical protein
MKNLGRESQTASPEQEAGVIMSTGRWMRVVTRPEIIFEFARYTLVCEVPVLHCAWNPQKIPACTVGIQEHHVRAQAKMEFRIACRKHGA